MKAASAAGQHRLPEGFSFHHHSGGSGFCRGQIWFSVSLGHEEPQYRPDGVPQPLSGVIDELAILICLRAEERHVRLQLVKDHGVPAVGKLHLELDPKTLLIAREA